MNFDSKKQLRRRITQTVLLMLSLGMVLGLLGCCARTKPHPIHDAGQHSDETKNKQPQTPHDFQKCASSEKLKTCLNLKGDALKTHIRKLESLLSDPEKKIENLEHFFQLALLYSCPRNPSPDYGKALNNIKKHCDLAPEDQKTSFKKYLLWLLTVLENRRIGLEKHKNKNRSLTETTQTLKTDYDKLAEENLKLKKIIEELQCLDIRLEKKRMPVE